jgi:8-oxo-dGTP pyrophosphatase MutT (NUDIX family)
MRNSHSAVSPARAATIRAMIRPMIRSMRYADAVARLTDVPSTLPAPPDVLIPVRLDAGERRPGMATGPPDAIPASVLVLVAPDRDGPDGRAAPDAEAEVILIERVARGHHAGEISFPGGRAEAGESPEETALREAAEEIGLRPEAAGVTVVGRLEPFWIPVSGYRVRPVLAIAASRPQLRPSPAEVASIVRAPLAAFLPGAPIEVTERLVRDFPLRFGAYLVAGHRVWGATARVLGQLGTLLG